MPLCVCNAPNKATLVACVLILACACSGRSPHDTADLRSFHAYCARGDVKRVEEMLQANPELLKKVNSDHEGLLAIHIAAEAGQVEVVKCLIKHGSPLNAKSHFVGRMPIHIAAKHGHVRVLQVLLDAKVDPNSLDEDKWTPLHDACAGGNREVAELLIAKGADVSAKSTLDVTPLHVAATFGRATLVELLLKHDAKVDAQDKDGGKAIDRAIEYGYVEITKQLLNKGSAASVRSAAAVGDVDSLKTAATNDAPQFGIVKDKLLRIAAINNQPKVLEFLIEQAADVNYRIARNSPTPLHEGVRRGFTSVVKLLLAAGGDPNLPVHGGDTCVHMAAQHNSDAMILRLLLRHGASVDAPDDTGHTGLSTAVRYRRKEMVEILVQYGANPWKASKHGDTPLDGADREMRAFTERVWVIVLCNRTVKSIWLRTLRLAQRR